MDTNILSDFDNDLCDYILGQLRPHLRSITVKSNSPSKLDYDGFHRLELPEWLGRAVAGMPTSLANHILAGVHGEPVVQSLNDSELNSLIIALADPPLRCEEEAVWMPYPALHRRATLCLPAISEKFTRQTAEEWARDCHTFSTALERDGLQLASGVEIVQDWLRLLRQLQDLMGKSSAITSSRSVEKQVLHPAENRQQPEMLTPSLVAKQYSVSRSTLYAACRSGNLIHYRVRARKEGRGKYLFKPSDVLHWLDTLRIGVVTSPTTPPNSVYVPASSHPAPALPSSFSELDPKRLARAWKSD